MPSAIIVQVYVLEDILTFQVGQESPVNPPALVNDIKINQFPWVRIYTSDGTVFTYNFPFIHTVSPV